VSSACTSCASVLENPLACIQCGALQDPASDPKPFQCFGLDPTFEVEPRALKKRLLKLQRLMHPDYFGKADGACKETAERSTALVNASWKILVDDVKRADHLVRSLGGPSEKDDRQMPQAFLIEVLEWNETLEEARGAAPDSSERTRLGELQRELASQRTECLDTIRGLLIPLPPEESESLTEVRHQLNAVRYIDRALSQIAELELAR